VQFTDLGTFYGSDYFLSRIGGYAPEDLPKRLGDSYLETRLVRDAVVEQTGQRWLNPDYGSDAAQMKALLDNAVDVGAVAGLSVGQALTAEQVAALDRDIIWYVESVIDGQTVLVPRLYLASASRDTINAAGATIAANDNVTLVSGSTIANDGGAIVSAEDVALLAQESIVNASGKITAGGDIDLTALTGDVLNVTKLVELKKDGSDVRDVRIGRGGIVAGGDLTVTAGQDIVSIGAGMAAGGTADLAAGRDVVLQSNELRHEETGGTKKSGYIIDNLTHDGSSLKAGEDVVIAAGRDVAVSGSTVSAGGAAEISAGRDIAVTAVVDQLYTESWSKKSGSSHEGTDSSQTNKGSTISAGGNVDLTAGNDLTLQASRAAAGGAIALEATEGQVALLSGTDSFFRHQKNKRKSAVWQSMQDKGESGTTVVMTELEAGGVLTVNAGAGVVADYRDTGGLQTSLAALAQDPKTAWVAEIAKRDDVKWQAVREQYDSWNYKSQGLTGPAAAVIAIAVAVATQGAGAAFAGALAAEGSMGFAMAQAGFAAMVSQASISLINNQGNLGKVLQELGSSASLRNLAVAMAAAGLTQGIAGTETFKDLVPQGNDLAARIGRQALQQSANAGVGVITDTVIQGQSLGSSLRDRLISAAIGTGAAVTANEIGMA